MSKESYELKEYQLKKSNALVHSKYRASDMEIDVINMAQRRVQIEYTDSGLEDYVARLYPNEINKLVKKGKNIYREMKKLAFTLQGHAMLIEDPARKRFAVFSTMPLVTYEDQVLTIHFAPLAMKGNIISIQDNYGFVLQNIAITSMLKGAYAKRLYEILSSHAYKIQGPNGKHHVTYRVSELKFMLGVANMDETAVKNKIATYKDDQIIDYDYLYDKVVIEKMFERWDSFSACVLKKAQKEMDKKADITFDYKGIREGHETKIVEFTIRRNVPEQSWEQYIDSTARIIDENTSETYKQLTLFSTNYPELDKFIGHNDLTEDDMYMLLQLSGNSEQMVLDAIAYVDSKKGRTDNYVGYLRHYITNDGYKKNIAISDGSVENAEFEDELAAERNTVKYQLDKWKAIKEHMELFKEFLEEKGVTVEQIESLISRPEDRIRMFEEWMDIKGR